MRRGTPRRSEQNQSLDEEIGKIPGSYHTFSPWGKESALVIRALNLGHQPLNSPGMSDREESTREATISEVSLQEVCLQTIWTQVAGEYFPHLNCLHGYLIVWSTRRQKRTLASVNLTRQRVLVAMELNDPLFFMHLPALLYHEMCHAVISTDVNVKNGKRQWHGKQFKMLEKQHPGIPELERWIKAGGWRYAVARHRARDIHRRRKSRAS
jgi:hypothetical protein